MASIFTSEQFWPFAACTAILCFGTAMDIRRLRIPNWITVPGFFLACLYRGIGTDWIMGPASAVSGTLAGCALLLPFFIAGGMGGGDVKLLGALGAWLGVRNVFSVFLYCAWVGAVLSVFIIAVNRMRFFIADRSRQGAECTGRDSGIQIGSCSCKMPYSPAIAAGFLIFWRYGALV